MITYELAKELKEAGFPQIYQKSIPLMDYAFDDSGELHLLHEDNDTGWWIGNDYGHHEMSDEDMQKNWVKCPTLSELIEACEDIQMSIYNLKNNHNHWVCDRLDAPIGTPSNGHGSTPEEAVARLWLALNKKQ